jgi:hypothetical protein
LEKLISNSGYCVSWGEQQIILLIKVDNQTYQRIENLVKESRYASMENFVELAVRNQLLLETEGIIADAGNPGTKNASDSERPQLSIPAQSPQVSPTTSLPENIKSMPLWGQVNRLAPAKFVLRLLLNNLVNSTEKSIDLKRFSAEAAERAAEFRQFLKKRDKTKRVRGTELYVAFPKKDPSSQQRFLNYYIGKASSLKWTDSVLTGLSFARIEETDDGAIVIELTEPGLRFATLHSPLVDDFFLGGKQIASSFSDEEISFLIDHIRKTRPGEYDFMKLTLTSIKRGDSTPTKLKDKINEFLKNKDLGFKFSEKVAITMQVGATGRLIELGLLKIEKQAQKTKYVVSNGGEDIVGKL